MNTPRFLLINNSAWIQRLLMAVEVEGVAYQYGLMASPTRINDCLAGDCLERGAELRTELTPSL